MTNNDILQTQTYFVHISILSDEKNISPITKKKKYTWCVLEMSKEKKKEEKRWTTRLERAEKRRVCVFVCTIDIEASCWLVRQICQPYSCTWYSESVMKKRWALATMSYSMCIASYIIVGIYPRCWLGVGFSDSFLLFICVVLVQSSSWLWRLSREKDWYIEMFECIMSLMDYFDTDDILCVHKYNWKRLFTLICLNGKSGNNPHQHFWYKYYAHIVFLNWFSDYIFLFF